MPEVLATQTGPLVTGPDGVIRVESTRVPLDIVAAFEAGATAEEIAQQYPTVSLAAAYQVNGYYLQHRDELDHYLAGRSGQRLATRVLNESRWPLDGLRDRLLARRK